MDVNDNAGYLNVTRCLDVFRRAGSLQWNALGMSCFSRTLISGSQEWHATRDCVRRLKKGVRLWLFAMAKG